ncbi:hypothetical protein G6F55_014142 [Rhizopus delemar]|nr:hypothetical protein G6F55_014142 [Rhizopus delemar]
MRAANPRWRYWAARRCCIGMATSSTFPRGPRGWPGRRSGKTRRSRWATPCWVCNSIWKRIPARWNAGWSAMPAN